MLSFLTATVNAKSLPSLTISPSFTNDLADRLAADKDFQELSISFYSLINGVKQSGTGVAFQNYFSHTISDAELTTLLKGLNFSSKVAFASFLKKLYLSKLEVNRKFPELINNDDLKTQVIIAAKRVVQEKLKPAHTVGDCWAFFLAGSSACLTSCTLANNWESCMEACIAGVFAVSSVCMLFAD